MANIELGCYRKNILNNFHTKSALLENNNETERKEKTKHTDVLLLSGLFNLSLCVVGDSYNCQANDNVNTIKHIIEHWTQITDH